MELWSEYLRSQSATVPWQAFAINLVLTGLCCAALARAFVAFGSTISNRRGFARNFVLLGLTTMVVVTVVKSSLALSLGLVGALSIIRFRGAIKEPEELAYLFISIAIGLGFGANQALITLCGLGALLVAVYLGHRRHQAEADLRPLNLSVSSEDPEKAGLQQIVATLEEGCAAVTLRRYDTTETRVDAAFQVEADSFANLEETRTKLHALAPSVRVSFVDNEGIF